MAYTSAQLVALACQVSKVPGFLTLGGQLLNTILEELWQVNDFAFSRQEIFINCTQQQPLDAYGLPLGYALPTNHERSLNSWYVVNGIPVPITQIQIERFDNLPSLITGTSYPEFICVDVAQTPRTVKVYPLPPLAVGFYMRYLPQQVAITSPESSSTIPWFPGQLYLLTRLSAELMMISDDSRREEFLANAEKLLSKFMTMGADDGDNFVKQVRLDPQSFRNSNSQRATKTMPL